MIIIKQIYEQMKLQKNGSFEKEGLDDTKDRKFSLLGDKIGWIFFWEGVVCIYI
jgi:hypothetical protein